MYAAIILRAYKLLCQLSLDNLTSHPVSTSIEELRIFANSMQRFLSEKEDYATIILEFENDYNMNLILNQSSVFPDKESILSASLLEKSILALSEGIPIREGSDSNES